MKVTILGCGPSAGVPLCNGEWGVCDPRNPRNRRTRTSAALTLKDGQVWLIDTSPDLRQQVLRETITRIDGVLLTHAHADHINGLDDLRPFYFAHKKTIPLYTDADTLQSVRARFPYLAHQKEGTASTYPLFLGFHEIVPLEPFDMAGVQVIPFEQDHGHSISLGFRFPTFAYSTDVLHLSQTALDVLKGVDTWVVDCMDIAPHRTHTHLDRTLEWIEIVRPNKAVLTHLSQAIDVEAIKLRLPPHVEPAYDGMVFEV